MEGKKLGQIAELNCLQNVLEGANIKLSGTVREINGKSGCNFLETLLSDSSPRTERLTGLPADSVLMEGINLLLVIPGILAANTPLWIMYPYCYSGYLVSCSLHDFTAETSDAAFAVLLTLSVTQFGKKEMR